MATRGKTSPGRLPSHAANRDEKTMTTIHKQINAEETMRTIMWWRMVTREVIVPPGGV